MDKLRCCTYIYQQVGSKDADSLNTTENRLFKVGVERGYEIDACIRDTKRTYRAGIQSLIEKMETQPFHALIIEELRQLCTGKEVRKLLSLFRKHSVKILTPRGERDLEAVIKQNEK